MLKHDARARAKASLYSRRAGPTSLQSQCIKSRERATSSFPLFTLLLVVGCRRRRPSFFLSTYAFIYLSRYVFLRHGAFRRESKILLLRLLGRRFRAERFLRGRLVNLWQLRGIFVGRDFNYPLGGKRERRERAALAVIFAAGNRPLRRSLTPCVYTTMLANFAVARGRASKYLSALFLLISQACAMVS